MIKVKKIKEKKMIIDKAIEKNKKYVKNLIKKEKNETN